MNQPHVPKQVCSVCGEDWPCVEKQVLDVAAHAEFGLRYGCSHCGKTMGKRIRMRMPDGTSRSYHWGKSHPKCGATALELLIVHGGHVWTGNRGQATVTWAAGHDAPCSGVKLTTGCRACMGLARLGYAPPPSRLKAVES